MKENFAKKQESHKRELAKKHFNDNLLYIINAEKDRETIPIKMNGRMNDWQKQFSLKILCGMIKKIMHRRQLGGQTTDAPGGGW